MIVGVLCKQHGYFSNTNECPECGKQHRGKFGIIDHIDPNWCHGWYEHIDVNPIKIESKQHLIHECEKRDLYARAFLKHKSGSGKGLEHRR